MAETVFIGMSGGVDSSVAAKLLLDQGYHVKGLFMKNWEEDDSTEYCAAHEDLEDAQSVCDQLNIQLLSVNFASEYWDRVFEYFLTEYKQGRTPNPDVMCNKEIKFKAFMDFALDLGADYIATGHYARIHQSRQFEPPRFELLKGLDENKDQSYFLYTLGQKELSRSLFPLGSMVKPEIRKIAAAEGFTNARKKDSTGICFIGERKFTDFLNRFIPASPGKIITPDNKTIGEHKGLMFHTIGQRQGLGIGGVKNATEEPWFVVDKDMENNHLIVAQGHEHPLLLHTGLEASEASWVSGSSPDFSRPYKAKIRYRQKEQHCQLKAIDHDTIRVIFDRPQRAITPGQSIVFYQDDICLGGAIINKRL